MNTIKNLEQFNDFQELRKVFKELQQISFNVSNLEKKFSIDGMTSEEELYLIRTYIAIKFDVEDILETLNKFYEKYKKKT